MITFKGLFIFFAVVVLPTSDLLAVEGELQVRFEPDQIRPGQTANLTVKLPADSSGQSESELQMAIQVVDDLVLKGKDYQVLSREFSVIEGHPTWVYKVTAYKPGSFSIPPIEFVWGARSFSTERLEFGVQSGREQNDNEIRPGFGAIDMPFRFPWWIWKPLLGLILLATAIYLALKYLPRHLKRPAKARLPEVPVTPPEDALVWLKRKLAEIRTRLEAGDRDPRIVDELTSVVRRYFAMKTGGAVESWTTQEFTRRLTYDRRARDLLQMFRDCDAYKFMREDRDPLEFASERLDKAESVLTKS